MKNLTFKAAMLNDSRTTVNRRSTDGQSQRHCKQTPLSKRWKVLMTLVFLFTFAIGNVWGATTLFTTNFSTTDGWSNENITTSGQPSNSKVIKGTTISFLGYKSASAKVSSATATGGTFTFTSNNLAASEGDITASNPNYYMAIPVSGIVCGMVTVTITTSSGYKPYYTYQDGASGKVADRLQAAVNNTFTITGLTSTNAVIYLGNSGKTMTSLTITTPDLTDLSESAFYQLYATTSKTCAKLIEDAELPTYITTNTLTEISSESGNSSSVSTPHDFTNLGTGAIYRLKTSNGSNIVLEGLSHVKSIRLYGNGNGSTRTVTVTATKISGAGTAPAISNISMPNSKKTVVEYSTGDLTEKSGYDINTYYTYTLSFNGACDIWGLYVEYAAPPCTNLDAPTGLNCSAQTVNTLTFGWTAVDHVSGYIVKLWDNAGCTGDPVATDANVTATSKTFTGLSASTNYWCKVQSKGNGTTYCAEGGVTSAAQGTTATPSCGVVTPPTFLQAGSITAEGATLLVTDAADAMNYEFYISEESTEPETSATATHTSTTKEKAITGLTSGTTYYVWVRSVCDADHKSIWVALDGDKFKVKAEPTTTFANGIYVLGGSALDLSALIANNNSAGAITYEITDAGTTSASISTAAFSATAMGTATVQATQAAYGDFAEKVMSATITVLDDELSDTYVWKKNTSYGGDDKCISASAANVDPNANAAYKELDFSSQTMTGMSAMGRPAHDNDEVTLTFAVKDAYNSLFAIKSLCVYGKLDEAEGAEISWDNGANWTAIAKYSESKRTFDAPTGVYPANFKIRFTAKEVSQDKGGLWWRNALVTLEVKKTVTGVTEALVGVEVNGEAISAANLATLQEDKTLDIATAYAAAPTVTFKKQVTTTYSGGWSPDVENVDVEVTASDNTTDWQASATINVQEYTITIAKPTAPSLETEATAFTLTSAKIATDTKSFTFSGINLTSSNVTIALESSVAGMTVTPAEVTPVAGVITDQEVTITYKSLEDVATANVNLVVYYDADTKIVLPLTYSSTKGYEDLTSISAATTWNWDGAANAAYGTLGQNDMIILANADVTWDEGFNARAIAGKLQHYYRDGKYAQGLGLKFHTTIQGIVEVTYSNTGGNAARTVNVNGVKGTLSSSNNKEEDKRTESFNVSAGDVLIKGVLVSDDSDQMLRFYEVSFVPTYIVNYWPGEGTGATIVDDNATVVADCPGTFTAPTGKMFYGWKDGENNDVAVGATVTKDMVLTAQWGDIMVAKIGDDMYPSLEAALLHAADGEIVLLQDIDVTSQIEIADGVTATIDLAGHKIEYTGSTTLSSGVILVHNGGTLTINDSSDPDAGSIVAGEKAYAAIAMTKAGDAATNPAVLVINGGIFTGYYYGITGNGSRPNTQITINGGTITATATNDNLGIYHPQNGTLTINGGTITGYASAIEMRAGTLVINDGTFEATASTFSCNPNGSGTTTVGAAIAIAQHTTKKDIEVTINGGTFEGEKALNESNPQANDPAPQVTMAVTAGTFTGVVSTVDVDKFVSGGTFDHPVLEEQCAEGYMPKDNGGGSYGVQYAGVIRGTAVKETIGDAEIPMYTLDNGVKIYSSGSNGQVSTSSNFSTGSDVAVCGGDAGKYSFNSNHIILKFPKNVSGFKIFGTGSTQRSINKVYSNATAGTDVQIKNVGVEHTGTFTGDKEQTAGKWCQYVEAVFDANNTIAKDEYVYVNLDGSMYAYRVIFTEAECTTPTVSLAGKSAYAGTEVTLTAEASALGATYTWYRCDDATGANPQVIAGKTAASYTFTKAVENEYIKVVVGCNCSTETAEAVATVLTRVDVTLQDVTDSITWDFSKSGIAAETNIPSEIVLANIPAVNNDKNFWSDKIQAGAGKLRVGYYQGDKLLFHTTVPGLLTVEFSNTGSSTRPFRELLINGNPTDAKSKDNTHVTYTVAVKSGDIELTARIYDNDGNPTANTSTLNFYLVEFDADLSNNAITEDVFNGYTRDVTEGRYGTICLPNGGIMVGAELYEVAYYDGTYEKIFLDEVLNGEMVAGRPYIFLTKEGVDKIAVFYTDEANAPEGDYHGLFGSYSKIHLTANDHIYILKDNRYYFVDSDNVYCGENRAYFKMGVAGGISGSYVAPAPGRRRTSIGAGAPAVATGIENTGFESEAPRKVLINGELFIIRGEKMYDAKGQLVK